jgi:hypothetical protein
MISFDYIGKPTAIVKPCNPTMPDAFEVKPDSNSKIQIEETDHIKAAEHQMSDSFQKDICNKQETCTAFEMEPFKQSLETEIDNVIPTLKENKSEVLDSEKSQNISSSYGENLPDNKGNMNITCKTRLVLVYNCYVLSPEYTVL